MSFRSSFLCFISGSLGILSAQPNLCVTSAVPPVVRAEGLTERIGDITVACNSTPNATVTANFTVALNTNISNRISTGGLLTGIVFTIDSGTGPQPVLMQPTLVSQNMLAFNGVTVPFSAQGVATLRFADIRANANGLPANTAITASLGVNGASLSLNASQFVVGRPQPGLYAGSGSTLICAQVGSPLPSTIDFAHLIQTKTAVASTRVTESFADSFGPRSATANLNADSGERFILSYSGFPQDARLFVADVIAGSDAVQPTAGGDFELPPSGGAYAPSMNGTLLLARVAGASANGAGGQPVYQPGAIGSGTVAFNSVTELTIVNGSTYVVYEVVDANPSATETVQIPTFLGLPADGNRAPSVTTSSVYFAPQSKVVNATPADPIPRFAPVDPQPDCYIVGDCATALPILGLNTTAIQLAGTTTGGKQQFDLGIRNTGGGAMPWQITVAYGTGSGWLSVNPLQGAGSTAVYLYADPKGLAPGTYSVTLAVDAGYAGSATIPVTFTVTAAVPVVSQVLNAASLAAAPAVPGSLTTLMGSNFVGKSVSVTFDGLPGTVTFSNATQINLLVPSALGSKTTSQLGVVVDGNSSQPSTVNVAQFSPAIFLGGVLNQDGTPNSLTNAASAGSVIQVFATGLSGPGTIIGHLHDRIISVPYYAGPAPGLLGVQQVNLTIPSDLPAMTTAVAVCGTPASGGAPVCSVQAPLTIK
jgi:uncharacterized protein (TIGR03437 family)